MLANKYRSLKYFLEATRCRPRSRLSYWTTKTSSLDSRIRPRSAFPEFRQTAHLTTLNPGTSSLATMTSGDIVVRPARHTDYHDVIALGDVYNGRDYVGAWYHIFLDDPSTYPVVALYKGKIVGFQFYHVIDEGQTVIGRAGRVHKDYRRLGILHRMREPFNQLLPSMQPPIKYRNFMVVKVTPSMAQEFSDLGFTQILRRDVRNFKLNVSDFRNISITDDELYTVGRLSPETLGKIFEKPELVDRLFPNRMVFIKFMGFRLLRGNVSHLIHQFGDVYATSSRKLRHAEKPIGFHINPSFKQDEKSFVFDPNVMEAEHFSDEQIETIDTISFSNHYPTMEKAGWVYEITLYSSPGIPQLDLHIRLHLQAFAAMSQGQGVLITSFNSQTPDDFEKVISCLRDHGVKERHPGTENESFFFEKELSPPLCQSKI